jgi:hypothetical protein
MASLASGWSKDEEKLIPKPEPFKGDAEHWNTWKWQFENWASVMHDQMSDLLEASGKSNTEIRCMTDPEHQKLNKLLYAVLGGLLKDVAHPFVRDTLDKSGFEAWRKLVKHYEPVDQAGRSLAWLQSLISVKFDQSSDLSWRTSLVSWESNIHLYETQCNKKLDDDLKKATVMRNITDGPLKSHLQLNAALYPTYRDMKEAIEAWMRSRENWTTTTDAGAVPTPMDISAITKAKGKGKDKGKSQNYNTQKGQGKGLTATNLGAHQAVVDNKVEGYCNNCGKWGHKKKDCWAPGGGASTAGSTVSATTTATNTTTNNGKGKGKDGKGGGGKGKGKGKGKGVNQIDTQSQAGSQFTAGPSVSEAVHQCAIILEDDASS